MAGKTDYPCPTCVGTGVTTNSKNELVRCTVCGGSGWLRRSGTK